MRRLASTFFGSLLAIVLSVSAGHGAQLDTIQRHITTANPNQFQLCDLEPGTAGQCVPYLMIDRSAHTATFIGGVASVAGRTGAVTLTNADVSGSAPLASPALTGTPTVPTATVGTNTTQAASTAFVLANVGSGGAVTSVAGRTGAVTLGVTDVAGAAPTASPAFTGTPTVPTATVGTNTTQAASTAFVLANVGSGGAVTSVAGRTGAVTLASTDITDATTTGKALVTATSAATGRTTLAAAASGANADITAMSGLTTPLPVTEGGTGATTAAAARTNLGISAGAGTLSFRNWIRNGNFSINQRVVSGTVTLAAGKYGFDGWKAGTSGATFTFSTAASGDTTVTITAGSLLQVIEGALLVKSTTATLSQAGTAQGRIYQGTAGAYATQPITATGLTAGTNTTVEWSTGTVSLAQLEPGSSASTFEYRDDELRRGQRYFWRLGAASTGATSIMGPAMLMTGSTQPVLVQLPVPMASSPTLTAGSGTFVIYSGPGNFSVSAISLFIPPNTPADTMLELSATTTSLSAGQAGVAGYLAGTGATGSNLDFSAEL